MPKRPRRQKSPRPAAKRARAKRPAASEPARGGQLLYKVVELSTVDEHAIESTVNQWVSQGWNLDGVQFAMRESSKRPSMAFVFFTRDDLPAAQPESSGPDEEAARQRLRRLAADAERGPAMHVVSSIDDTEDPRTFAQPATRSADPWQRLAELAGEGEDDEGDPPS